MKKNTKLNLEFVENAPKYYEFIRKLRNNPVVKRGFIQQGNISKSQQLLYMKKNQNNYFLCLSGDKPVGYVGVIEDDIRIAVLPEFQGKNIGLFLIKNVMKKYKTLQAKIKIENEASLHLFKKAGFKMKYYLFEYNQKEAK